jgi:hypothetical protein
MLKIELASRDFSPVAVLVVRPAPTLGHALAPAPVNKLFLEYYKQSTQSKNIILTDFDVNN